MLRSLLVDFNSYFASVEQQVQPALRGRAVGVLPVMTDSTCCIAASQEAKRFGVKTGTPVREARRLCPAIVFVLARHEVYVDFHHRAIAAVDRIAPVRQVLSIDEMECELTGRWRAQEQAVAIARRIKQEIEGTVGECLKSSIGIAPNTMLAKLASDMHKPDGLTVLTQADIPQGLYHLKLTDISGIGHQMHARLQRSGIHTIEALYAAPRDLLRTVWGGVAGEDMHDKLRGHWSGLQQTPNQVARSLGHSHVLPPALRTSAGALSVLNRLTQKAGMRLRKQALFATAMSVHVRADHRLLDAGGGWRETRFGETQDTGFFLHVLHTFWQSGLSQLHAPKAVGITLSGLVPQALHTLPLFDEAPRERSRLHAAIDQLNRTYGKNALYFASAHGALHEAPMRIAFNRIPDIETER
jgi:DNA polymerase IV